MRLKFWFTLVLLELAGRPGPGAAQTAGTQSYVVTYDQANPRRIQVAAELDLVNDTLMMATAMAGQLPNGWATFVHDLTAHDGKTTLSLDPLAAGRWLIRGRRPAHLSLTYQVMVDHDSVRWNVSGAWARGYVLDGTVFVAGRAIFIAAGGTDKRPAQVRFQLPLNWSVETPYLAISGTLSTYRAASLEDLWANGILAGPLSRSGLTVGGLRVIFAGGPAMREGIAVYGKEFEPIMVTFDSIMGGAPAGKLVVLVNLRRGESSGEAFQRSISLWVPDNPEHETRGQWGYLLAHEAFHQWNPVALPPADQTPFEWFVEGFTDYMAKLAMLRTGMISEQEFYTRMARTYSGYLGVAGRISLRAAGVEKGRNFTLVYNGGSTLAAALDGELRGRTNGTRGVPQFLARMAAEYRRTGRRYTEADFARILSEVAGSDMSGFIARYVDGVGPIPLGTSLAAVGLSLIRSEDGVSIERATSSTPSQTHLLEALLSR